MSSVLDGKSGLATYYEYDPAGRVARQRHPNRATTYFSYDAAGRLSGKLTDAAGDPVAMEQEPDRCRRATLGHSSKVMTWHYVPPGTDEVQAPVLKLCGRPVCSQEDARTSATKRISTSPGRTSNCAKRLVPTSKAS